MYVFNSVYNGFLCFPSSTLNTNALSSETYKNRYDKPIVLDNRIAKESSLTTSRKHNIQRQLSGN